MDQTAVGRRRNGKWWEGENKSPRRQAVETVEFSVPAGRTAGRSARGPIRAPIGRRNPSGGGRGGELKELSTPSTDAAVSTALPPACRPGFSRGGGLACYKMPCSRKEKNPDALTTT